MKSVRDVHDAGQYSDRTWRRIEENLRFAFRLFGVDELYLHDEGRGWRAGLDWHWHPSDRCPYLDETIAAVFPEIQEGA